MVVEIHDSTADNIAAITAIYAHWVQEGLASFELTPPAPAEIDKRRRNVLAAGFPYLVAQDENREVVGFAYADWYRTRPAYRFTCEDSVYVAPAALGRGTGKRLLATLIERCTALHMRLMVAVIGDSANRASLSLHRRAGFETVGVLRNIGWKQGRWVDSVLMTRRLGSGGDAPPHEHGRLLESGK